MTNEEKRVHMFGVKKPTNKMDNAWAHHKAKFHPEIDSPEEESVRKAQFVKTHKMIDEHNSDPEATHQLTHNHFSAMTNEEKKKHFFGVKPAVDEQEKVAESEVESAEDDIMVRKIPGTLNKSNAEIMHNLNKLQGLRQPTRRTNPTTTTKKAPYTVTGHFFAHRG